MDVTPTDQMFKAMSTMVDAFCGEAPLAVETSAAANRRRDLRRMAFDNLHKLVHLSMREGAARAANGGRRAEGGVLIPLPNDIPH